MADVLYKVFENYGFPGLLICALIGVLIWLFKRQNTNITKNMGLLIKSQTEMMNNNFDKLLDMHSDQNKQLLEYVLQGEREKHRRGLEKRQDALRDLRPILKNLQVITKASRLTVIEFHNSKENLNGLPFKWYDIQAEWVDRGVDPIMLKTKNIQAYNLVYIADKVNDSKNNYIVLNNKDIDDLRYEAPTLYNQLALTLKLDTIVYVGLYNCDNLLVGFLTLEYENPKFDFSTFEGTNDEACLMEQACIIEKLLES